MGTMASTYKEHRPAQELGLPEVKKAAEAKSATSCSGLNNRINHYYWGMICGVNFLSGEL